MKSDGKISSMPESMLGRAEINSHIKVSKEEMVCNCRRPDHVAEIASPTVTECLTFDTICTPSTIRRHPSRAVSFCIRSFVDFYAQIRALLEYRPS